MSNKLFDIFKHKSLWLFVLYYSCNVKKQSSPDVIKTLHLSDYAERLTRETGKQNIVVGNIFFVNFCDVACRSMPKVGFIAVLAIFVNVR